MVSKLPIEDFLQHATGHTLIDVRAPKEYGHGHIPGAISLPLFSDDERAIIGTLYKQQGREIAMFKGLDFYGNNMKRILEDLKEQTLEKEVYVHCWRGGMRSGVVAWMLDLFGYKVTVLSRGYKAFRRTVLDSFAGQKEILILGGKTGSGKTDVLHEIASMSQQVVDLEDLAHHKGSAFGALKNLSTPTQEQFENDLFFHFKNIEKSKPVLIEDESQRIGQVNLPNQLWSQMRMSQVVYLEIPFEARLDYLVEGYGNADVNELKAATFRIQKRLGGLDTKNTILALETGKIKEAFSILLRYYDKMYLKATSQRYPDSVHFVRSDTVDQQKNALLVLNEMKLMRAACS